MRKLTSADERATRCQSVSRRSGNDVGAAKRCFDKLLEKHEPAFADHGAAFYHDLGKNPGRALELARRNVANRPTVKALKQAHAIAVDAGELQVASNLLTILPPPSTMSQ